MSKGCDGFGIATGDPQSDDCYPGQEICDVCGLIVPLNGLETMNVVWTRPKGWHVVFECVTCCEQTKDKDHDD